MREQKHQLTIKTGVFIIHKVYEIQENRKLASLLLMDLKKVFNYVSQTKLVQRIVNLGINNNLMGWTLSFLKNMSVELVIDKFINLNQKIESEIP